MTLGDTKTNPLGDAPGRIALLREMCNHKGIHILGVQEARTQEGQYTSHNYIRFASGATPENTHGVELWFARTLPFATTQQGQPHFFKENCFSVSSSSYDILIAKYEDENFDFMAVSAHAPHNGRENEYKDDWWRKLTAKIKHLYKKGQLIILIDGNARLGTEMSHAIGGKTSDTEDENGYRLRAFAEEFSLFVPSTFNHIHQGEDATWTHPNQTNRSRLDYVIVDCRLP